MASRVERQGGEEADTPHGVNRLDPETTLRYRKWLGCGHLLPTTGRANDGGETQRREHATHDRIPSGLTWVIAFPISADLLLILRRNIPSWDSHWWPLASGYVVRSPMASQPQ